MIRLYSNPRVTRFKINWDGTSSSSIGESSQPGTSEQGKEEQNDETGMDGQDDNRSPTKEEFERPIFSGDDAVKQIDVKKDDSKLPNSAEVENIPQNGQAVTTKSPPSLGDQALANQFNEIKSGSQSSGNIEPLVEQA